MQDLTFIGTDIPFSPSPDPIYPEWLKSNLVLALLKSHLMAPYPSALSPDVPFPTLSSIIPNCQEQSNSIAKKKKKKGERRTFSEHIPWSFDLTTSAAANSC